MVLTSYKYRQDTGIMHTPQPPKATCTNTGGDDVCKNCIYVMFHVTTMSHDMVMWESRVWKVSTCKGTILVCFCGRTFFLWRQFILPASTTYPAYSEMATQKHRDMDEEV